MSLLVFTKLNTVVNMVSSRGSRQFKRGSLSFKASRSPIMTATPVFGELPKS